MSNSDGYFLHRNWPTRIDGSVVPGLEEQPETLALREEWTARPPSAALLLYGGECSQFFIPVRFECVSDKPIAWVYLHVAMPGFLDFILRALNMTMSQTVSVIESAIDFGLNGECEL